jgi:hypothetical protein
MRQRKIILVLILTPILAFQAKAQFDVKLHITDGIADTVIKFAIEKNSSLLLSELGKAFAEDRTPDFMGISISPEASKTILDIWNNTSVMNCNVSELNRKCLQRYDGGYQIREIPLLMVDAASDDQRQDIAINYTDIGTVDEIFIYDKDMYSIGDILSEGGEVKELRRREYIQSFVERFRTAYNTKEVGFFGYGI